MAATENTTAPATLPAAAGKPVKTLPTDRVSFDKQLSILRAYAAASGNEHRAVSNTEVSSIAGLSASSISICNGFFNDVGLLAREGQKQKPADAVFSYMSAYEWNPDQAAAKLAPALKETRFAGAIIPVLAFRVLQLDEGITRLAEAAKAAPSHKTSLRILLDYLVAAKLVNLDNDSLKKAMGETPAAAVEAPLTNPSTNPPRGTEVPPPAIEQDHFSIPIPGKASAVITIPKNLDADDWVMLEGMIKAYVGRLRSAREWANQKQRDEKGGGQ